MAHTGFSVAPARVGELLNQHKDTLWGELSYRGGITGGDGKLTSDWRDLFERYSDRFLLGSDTWINERWFGYDTIFRNIAAGLRSFPPSRRAASPAEMHSVYSRSARASDKQVHRSPT
jgi:hypothetical protein